MRTAIALLVLWPATALSSYPLAPNDFCGAGRTCREILRAWNAASWDALVDDEFHIGSPRMAAVRKYDTEGNCSGFKCADQLTRFGNLPSNPEQHQFYGVTDELGNVLLSHAIGEDQERFTPLRNFVEFLRDPRANNLPCWQYHINGRKAYTSNLEVCIQEPGKTPPVDTASDGSLRILGAYGIACAKQRAGIWSGGPDFCADYQLHGRAIAYPVTANHGEVKLLANGEHYLANGFRNQEHAPTNYQAFRPDYYELQFLMDYAVYANDGNLQRGVIEMLDDYRISMGSNHIHRGKTGHFNASTTTYMCDELCTPAYMDNIDTWRAIPALSGLLVVHQSRIPTTLRNVIFDYWWTNYGSAYPPGERKPFEIYADQQPAVIETKREFSYKTFGMWIPLGVAYDHSYARTSVRLLTENYDWSAQRFYGAAYYGGYFSQFAQRAIGLATGLMDPSTYVAPPAPPRRRRAVRH